MMSPFVMIIFGATGDLTLTKLLPALFNLFKEDKLPEQFFIVGFARRIFTDEEFRKIFSEKVGGKNLEAWEKFTKHLYYQQGEFSHEGGYKNLTVKLKNFDDEIGACLMRIFYFATPPVNYSEILNHLQNSKLAEGCGQGSNKWTRVAIEKPFGKDLETAKELDSKLVEIFEEKQIFRVDHYLGKDTVQNLIAFRFANGIFEPVWNKNYIDHIQITWSEKQGVGERGRGKFFDGVGILRDVAQNHLMQLIAAVAMESPATFSKDGVRDVRAQVIKSIRKIELKDVVRGQYKDYKKEKDVTPDSQTETFVAMKLFVDSERFKGVPIYIRAGNKLPKDVVEINIVFIQTCHLLFKEYGCPEEGNVLTIRIQPEEGIRLKVLAKKPGAKFSFANINLKFSYNEEFDNSGYNSYERLLLDIFSGDQMLFNRSDELESSWELITNILKGSEKEQNILEYKQNTWGPDGAMKLIEKDGKKWI